jgi:hypothetical protein
VGNAHLRMFEVLFMIVIYIIFKSQAGSKNGEGIVIVSSFFFLLNPDW